GAWTARCSARSRGSSTCPLRTRSCCGSRAVRARSCPSSRRSSPRSTSAAVSWCSTRPAGCSRPTPSTSTSPHPRRSDVRIDVLTIFPEYLAPLELSLIGKSRESGLVDLRVADLRDWTTDRHRTVDDTPFGGGAGMVMRPDVWGRALDDTLSPGAHLLVPT